MDVTVTRRAAMETMRVHDPTAFARVRCGGKKATPMSEEAVLTRETKFACELAEMRSTPARRIPSRAHMCARPPQARQQGKNKC